MRATVLAVAVLLSGGCDNGSPQGPIGPRVDVDVSEAGWTKYTNLDTGNAFEIEQAFRAIVFYGIDAEGQCRENRWRLSDVSEWAIVSAVDRKGLEFVFYKEEWATSSGRLGIYNHDDRTFTIAESVPADRYVTFRCAR